VPLRLRCACFVSFAGVARIDRGILPATPGRAGLWHFGREWHSLSVSRLEVRSEGRKTPAHHVEELPGMLFAYDASRLPQHPS
jgi:hypothetical protein